MHVGVIIGLLHVCVVHGATSIHVQYTHTSTSSLSPSVTLPVVDQLLSLYSLTDSSDDIIARARVTVEKAILLRGRGSPLSLLEEAMVMLEPLVGVRAYEQLAVTHLWRAICVAEQQIA